jgi:DNA invertase Pin-like site-specific DNA recombinase
LQRTRGRGMKLGYARVSTEEQTLDLQRPRLLAAGCGRLFEEKISGAKRNRPELEKLLGEVRKNDILVVTRLDRLARSTVELLAIAERLREKDAGLQSLDEPWVDTESPSGRMILTVFAGIAEFERALIRQRTKDGLVDARKRGVAFGRPPKMRPDQQALVRELINQGQSVSQVARTFNVHPATIYRCREASEGL